MMLIMRVAVVAGLFLLVLQALSSPAVLLVSSQMQEQREDGGLSSGDPTTSGSDTADGDGDGGVVSLPTITSDNQGNIHVTLPSRNGTSTAASTPESSLQTKLFVNDVDVLAELSALENTAQELLIARANNQQLLDRSYIFTERANTERVLVGSHSDLFCHTLNATIHTRRHPYQYQAAGTIHVAPEAAGVPARYQEHGYILTFPVSAASPDIVLLDPHTLALETVSLGEYPASISSSATGLWNAAAIAPNDKLVFVPFSAPLMLVLDTVSLEPSYIPLPEDVVGPGAFWGNARGVDGNIYAAPYSSNDVLVFNPFTSTFYDPLALDMEIGALDGKWAGIIAHNDGILYCVPHNAAAVLTITPTAILSDEEQSQSGPNLAVATVDPNAIAISAELAGASTRAWIGGVLAPNGNIYGIPHLATSILVIHASTSSASYIPFARPSGSGQFRWVNGVYHPASNKIYGMPQRSNAVLIISPDSGEVAVELSPFNQAVPGATDFSLFTPAFVGRTGRIFAFLASADTPANNETIKFATFDTAISRPDHSSSRCI